MRRGARPALIDGRGCSGSRSAKLRRRRNRPRTFVALERLLNAPRADPAASARRARQGVHGEMIHRPQPPLRAAIRRHQLCGDSGNADRKRVVRLSRGGLSSADERLWARSPRLTVARCFGRDRRHATGPRPIAQGAAEGEVLRDWRGQAQSGRYLGDLRDPLRSRRDGPSKGSSRGSLLPAQCRHRAPAAIGGRVDDVVELIRGVSLEEQGAARSPSMPPDIEHAWRFYQMAGQYP